MKHVTFLFFAIFILQNICMIVQAQNTEQCNTIINFNDDVLFDTTAMFCQTVWSNKDYILRYAQAGSELWSFLLSAPKTNSWLGIGFSTTGQMVGSSAMVGWIYQNGTAIVKQYYLQAKDPDEVTPDAGELNVKMNTTTVFTRSNRMYLAFQINTSQPPKHLLYALGQYNRLPVASDGLKLLQHREQDSASLDYSTGKSETRSNPYTTIKRTHGALNMIGWGILMPIGAIAARYFRQWDPIWFYSHAIIQIFAFLFGLVGFILGLIVEGFINAEITHHKNLGILILILGCLQVMAVLIRPKKGTKLRKYWNWYHHNAGRILIILAISNIFYGIHLGMEGSRWYSTYAVILALMLILAIILEIRLCRQT